jgi:hypothetical protein
MGCRDRVWMSMQLLILLSIIAIHGQLTSKQTNKRSPLGASFSGWKDEHTVQMDAKGTTSHGGYIMSETGSQHSWKSLRESSSLRETVYAILQEKIRACMQWNISFFWVCVCVCVCVCVQCQRSNPGSIWLCHWDTVLKIFYASTFFQGRMDSR